MVRKKGLLLVFLVLMGVLGIVGLGLAQQVSVRVDVTSEPMARGATCEKAGAITFTWQQQFDAQGNEYITIDLDPKVVLCKDYDFNDTVGGVDVNVSGTKGTGRIVVKFLEEGTINEGDQLVLFEKSDGVEDYLCINISGTTADKIQVNIDSYRVVGQNQLINDIFVFLPSNPQVAHVYDQAYRWYSCKGEPGLSREPIPTYGEQESRKCSISTGFWRYIEASPGFENANYELTLGLIGPAYWASNMLSLSYDACAEFPTYPPALFTAYLADGKTPVTAFDTDCEVDQDKKAKILKGTLSLSASQKYLGFKIPALSFDLNEVKPGDRVQLKVILSKVGACGKSKVLEGTFDIVEFVAMELGKCILFFPYTTAWAAGDGWWDGMAIVNPTDSAMSCTMTVFETDGDQGVYNFNVEAHKMWVDLLSNVVSQVTKTSGTGTIGDARAYVIVECEGAIYCDGFYMTGSGYEAQGYLPRVSSKEVWIAD